MTQVDRPFRLDPRTGDSFRSVDQLSRAANLDLALTGYDVMETSLGRNLALMLQASAAARVGEAHMGRLAVTGDVEVVEGGLRVQGMTLHLLGHALHLCEEVIPMRYTPVGEYQLNVEVWRALVGPSSRDRATEPVMYLGVTDSRNKPSAGALFPAGNVRASAGPSDAPLVTATLITQKFLQWQYRISLVPRQPLEYYETDLLPRVPENPLVPAGPTRQSASFSRLGQAEPLYVAQIPQDAPGAYDRAFDRLLYAFPLAEVTVTATETTAVQGEVASGRDLALRLPPYHDYVQAQAPVIAGLLARLQALEARTFYADYRTTERLAVQPSTAGGVLEPTMVPFGLRQENGGDLTEFDEAHAARITLREGGRYRVVASAAWSNFPREGTGALRLWVDDAPTTFGSAVRLEGDGAGLIPISIVAELSLAAGSLLRLEVAQNTGATAHLASGVTLSLSRV